jgi:cytochrome c551/c552
MFRRFHRFAHRRRPGWAGRFLRLVSLAGVLWQPDARATDADAIRSLLDQRCWDCHSHDADKVKAGLFLDSRSGLLVGGDSGPAVVPGAPDQSLVIRAVRYLDVELQMPPKSRLTDAEISQLEQWVLDGAPWPDSPESAGAAAETHAEFSLEERRRTHWAWHPVRAAKAPPVSDVDWPTQPIDSFILAELEAKGIRPAPEADRRVLIRRLSFLLTGLPPSADDVAGFVTDRSPGAYERQVEKMLGSPRFGERWARHWLDVVRFAETFGHEFDYALPDAWRYRDYVIRAFNSDLPYDRFIREHLAGDLLKTPRRDPASGLNESAIATGFFWFGQQAHSPVDVKAHQLDVIDNQIDTLTRGFQALTVSCARCHDHKFDAISTKDFYALYGMLASSRYTQTNVGGGPDADQKLEELARMRAEFVRRATGYDGPGVTAAVKVQAHRDARPGRLPFVGLGEAQDWFLEDAAMTDAEVGPGDLLFLGADQPVVRSTMRLVSSRKLSRWLQGSLRSPNFTVDHRFLRILVAGHGTRARVVLENYQLIRDPIYGELRNVISSDAPAWITFDLDMWQGRRAYLELLDTTTHDLAAGTDSGSQPDGWFDLLDLSFSNEREPPGAAPAYEAINSVPSEALEMLGALERAAHAIQSAARAPAFVDSEGLDEHVFIRGNPRQPGERVARRYLEALGGLDHPIETGSGRDRVAELVASADNPLTARVWVNRVWHHLFGRGLVPTVDDFGVLGEAPSHPELLDWLAHWFVGEGQWSTKRLIRMLVTSSVWRQSAHGTDAGDALDPANVLLHRWTVRRLEGEAIRDGILAVSGRLDLTPYGPSVPVHLTDFMTGRGRPDQSGPLDGSGRRSVYLEVRRNFVPPMMLAFDTPQAAQTFGRRARSNVPAQALILMNDPFVRHQADLWADHMLECCGPDPAERIDWLYAQAFQRRPTDEEQLVARDFLRSASITPSSDNSEAIPGSAWADLCHVLFNTKEFIFVN